MDYGKYRYQQQKKEDKSRASSKAGQLKELKMKTVKIGDHDLMIKINHARAFLADGNKVQFTLQFRGREMAHLDLGRDIFRKIEKELWAVSKIERAAKMEGRRMTLVLQPEKKTPEQLKQQAANTGGGSKPAMAAGASLNIPQRPAAGAPVAGGPRPAPVAPVAAAAPKPAPVAAVAQPAGAPAGG